MSDTGRRIVKASLAVMLAHLIVKFMGVIQSMLILPRLCDPGTQELFAFAFDSVLMAFYLIGEEGLGPAFLPVFLEEMDKRGEDAAWRFANTLLTVQALVLAAVVGVVMLWPEAVVNLLTDWEKGTDLPGYAARAPRFIRTMFPGLLGLSIGSMTYLILNGYKRFFLAALGDASVKVAIVLAALAGAWFHWDPAARATEPEAMSNWLCLGIVAGGVAKALTHLVGLRREAGRFRPRAAVASPAFRRFLWLILPLLAGIVLAKVRDLYVGSYILSRVKELGESLIRVNKGGRQIFLTIGWLLPYAVSIAVYPFFCEMVNRNDRKEMARLLTLGSQIVTLLIVPVAALLFVLALPVARLIYQNPNFDLHTCDQAALATACYTLVLPFFALEYLFMQAFFSHRKMAQPVFLGIFFSLLNMLLVYLGAILYRLPVAEALAEAGVIEPGQYGHAALVVVALAFTVTRALKVIVLALWMKGFLPDLDGRYAARFALRLSACGLAAVAAAWGVRSLYESRVDTAGADHFSALAPVLAPLLLLAGGAGLAAYLAGLRLLCPAEWRETHAWTRARLAAFRARKNSPPGSGPE